MKNSVDPPASFLALKPLYKLSELERLVHISRYRLWRLFEEHSVKCISAGRVSYVPLSEIKEKIPTLWRSLCTAIEGSRMASRALRS